MKKTFPLQTSGQPDARLVEGVVHDVRKYVKRERRKAVPEGVDFWDFDCKVGADAAEPAICHVEEVVPAIQAAAQGGAQRVYVEILAKPGVRTKKPVVVVAATAASQGEAPLHPGENPAS